MSSLNPANLLLLKFIVAVYFLFVYVLLFHKGKRKNYSQNLVCSPGRKNEKASWPAWLSWSESHPLSKGAWV